MRKLRFHRDEPWTRIDAETDGGWAVVSSGHTDSIQLQSPEEALIVAQWLIGWALGGMGLFRVPIFKEEQ